MHLKRFAFQSKFAPLLLLISVALGSPVYAGLYYYGVTPTNLFWPGGIIPYEFDTNYPTTAAQQSVFLDIVKEWELAANIHLIPRTNQPYYLLLRYDPNSGSGFFLLGTPDILNVSSLSRGYTHEMGHALGLDHEHVRPDRDSFITVNWNNIVPTATNLFVIVTNELSHGPYDMESIMHYNRENYSISPGVLDSLVPKPVYYEKYYYRIAASILSNGDRAAAAYLYGPPATPLTNLVTTTSDGGFGSLRAAIYFANDHPGTTIRFNIPTNDPGYTNGIWKIKTSGELPALVGDGTIIDGGTQPSFTDHPVIFVDGSAMIAEAGVSSGLRVWQANCAIKNLGLITFSNSGLVFETPSATNNTALGCYVGVDANGTNAAPNGNDGVLLYRGTKNNVIGGTNTMQRNVISGNAPYGIQISGTNTAGITILGNYIGTAATGESALSTNSPGICIFDGASGITIGGLNGGRNVISGNASQGIFLDGVSNVFVMGNYIGTAASGTNVVVNGFPGIEMVNGTLNVVIGGTNSGTGNLISGNTGSAITVNGSSKIIIQGNYIGTDAGGNNALGNEGPGILTFNTSRDLLISGNLISGNLADGVYLENTHQSVVQGNYIGVTASGSAALPNAYSGINILNGASGLTIGGTTVAARNIVSGNSYHGIQVSGDASNNIIEGNFIGTDSSGNASLGNGVIGVYFFGGPRDNSVGLKIDGSGAGNVIAFNGYTGVHLDDTNSIGNTIRGNAIFNNGGLGIDLAGPVSSGVTLNDASDVDVGPNNLQNYPVITNAVVIFSGPGPFTTISGTLNSTPNGKYLIDLYRNASADPSGFGEGQFYFGSVAVTNNGSGNSTFTLSVAGDFSGQYFTATATDKTSGDTSEFSANVPATNAPTAPTFIAPITMTSTGFVVNISLSIGLNYRVQAATNLSATPIVWTDLTNFHASTANFIFLDRSATNLPSRFYRVVSP